MNRIAWSDHHSASTMHKETQSGILFGKNYSSQNNDDMCKAKMKNTDTSVMVICNIAYTRMQRESVLLKSLNEPDKLQTYQC